MKKERKLISSHICFYSLDLPGNRFKWTGDLSVLGKTDCKELVVDGCFNASDSINAEKVTTTNSFRSFKTCNINMLEASYCEFFEDTTIDIIHCPNSVRSHTNLTITEELQVPFAEIYGNLFVMGNLSVDYLVVHGNLAVEGDVSIKHLKVGRDCTFGSNTSIETAVVRGDFYYNSKYEPNIDSLNCSRLFPK